MVVTVLNVKDGIRAGEEVEEAVVVEVIFLNLIMPQTKLFPSLGSFMSLSRFKVL